MINTQDLLGSLLQAGATRSGETRVRHAMSEEGLGGANDILGQLLGGAGSGGSILGNLGLSGFAFALQTGFEIAQSLAKIAHNRRDLTAPAEKQQNDCKYDKPVHDAERTTKHCVSPGL